MVFPLKNKKNEQHHWILRIWIIVATKFQLQLIILSFWTKFAQKGYFYSKTRKMNITIEFCMFQLVLVRNFSLKWQFWCFLLNLPIKAISTQKRKKNEHHHWILHVRISFGIKFQLKVTILMFSTKFAHQGYFHSKTKKKWTSPLNSACSN